MRDELAEVLNKTEFTIVRFYQKGNLSQRLGQLLFERPFAEIAVQVYKLWKEKSAAKAGCARLVGEIMWNPKWKKQFELIFRQCSIQRAGV